MTDSYMTTDDYSGRIIYVENYRWVEIPQTVYYPTSNNEFTGSLDDTIYYLSDLRNKYGGGHLKKMVYMNYTALEFIYRQRKCL